MNFVEEEKAKPKEEEKVSCYNEEESKFTLRKLGAKYPRSTITAIESSLLRLDTAPKWEAVVAHPFVKAQLVNNIVAPLKQRSSQTSSAALLYGPLGNGKSLLAKSLASHFGPALIFFSLNANDFSSESAMSAVFEASTISQPCIVLVNGIDGLLGSDSANLGIRKGFLEGIDYIKEKYKGKIVIVGVTNQPFSLDKDALKRFEVKVYIPLPDAEQRANFIKKKLEKLNSEQCKSLGEITQYFSFDNLEKFCEEMKKRIRHLTFDSLVETGLKKVTATASARTVEQFEEWNKANHITTLHN